MGALKICWRAIGYGKLIPRNVIAEVSRPGAV